MNRLVIALLGSVLLATTGCAGQISNWIVQTRNHQGDIALDHQNSADASIAYQLALRVQPTNAHARAGLVAVQARIAQTLFTASRFDDAVKALDVANRYAPGDPRIEALRTQIEQAEVKRDIVVSNYPAYRETGAGLRTSFVRAARRSGRHRGDAEPLRLHLRLGRAHPSDPAELRAEFAGHALDRPPDPIPATGRFRRARNADTAIGGPGLVAAPALIRV